MKNSIRIAIVSIVFLGAKCFADYEAEIDTTLPKNIAAFDLQPRQNFSEKELGFKIGYKHPNDNFIGVYIYNLGEPSLPESLNSEKVIEHFNDLVKRLKMLKLSDKVKNLNIRGTTGNKTTFEGCGIQYLRGDYEVEFIDGNTLLAFTYLTVVKGHFIKIRARYNKGNAKDEKLVNDFFLNFRQVLAKCGKA